MPPTASARRTADWGVAGYAIIEAPSVLGLFPGGVEHLPRALLDSALPTQSRRAMGVS
jgi:hypothetical protein